MERLCIAVPAGFFCCAEAAIDGSEITEGDNAPPTQQESRMTRSLRMTLAATVAALALGAGSALAADCPIKIGGMAP